MREYQRELFDLKAAEGSFACEWCGTITDTTYYKARYCSRPCKDAARLVNERKERLASKEGRTCLHCAAPISPKLRSDASYCSPDCNSAAHQVVRKMAFRAKTAKTKFNRSHIAQRDGWRCRLCGGRVARWRKHPDPLAPSIDHRLPLARGGTNDPANLQLAHLRCNLSKRCSLLTRRT